MTKPRAPGSFEAASVTLRDHFREEGCAGIIGMSESRVKQACDSERSNYTPYTLTQALDLDTAYHESTGKPGPLLAVYLRKYHERTGLVSEPVEITPLERVGGISSETQDAVNAIVAAHAPQGQGGKQVTPREALQCVREIDEAIAELERSRSHYARSAGISESTRPGGVKALLREAS